MPAYTHTHAHSNKARGKARQTERERERLTHACALRSSSSSIKRKQQQAAQYTHAHTHTRIHSLDSGQGVAGKRCRSWDRIAFVDEHTYMYIHTCRQCIVHTAVCVCEICSCCLMCLCFEEIELEGDCRRFNWNASWAVAAVAAVAVVALVRYCLYQYIETILVLLTGNCRRQHWQSALLAGASW